MTRLNGNTPFALVVIALGLYATVLTFQETRLRDLAECGTRTATNVAVLQSEYQNIKESLDEIKAMLQERGR
jgi:hypothetical protein